LWLLIEHLINAKVKEKYTIVQTSIPNDMKPPVSVQAPYKHGNAGCDWGLTIQQGGCMLDG
jgi:hypothetical protein